MSREFPYSLLALIYYSTILRRTSWLWVLDTMLVYLFAYSFLPSELSMLLHYNSELPSPLYTEIQRTQPKVLGICSPFASIIKTFVIKSPRSSNETKARPPMWLCPRDEFLNPVIDALNDQTSKYELTLTIARSHLMI